MPLEIRRHAYEKPKDFQIPFLSVVLVYYTHSTVSWYLASSFRLVNARSYAIQCITTGQRWMITQSEIEHTKKNLHTAKLKHKMHGTTANAK